MEELDLILSQRRIDLKKETKEDYSMNTSDETYYEEEYSRSLTIKRKTVLNNKNSADKYEELKIELANTYLEECKALEEHTALWDSYNLLENLIESVLNHIDCGLLESRSIIRLGSWLNSYAVRENRIDEEISNCLKVLNEKIDFEEYERMKTKLLVELNSSNSIIELHADFELRRHNFKLAFKNLKILLEILNVNEDSLGKLKQQFDEILMNYQHCRCILDRNLPVVISQRNKMLLDGLSILRHQYAYLEEKRTAMNRLLVSFPKNLQECLRYSETGSD
ncbi:uncharacterized protein LOC132704335 [Cylas formicarius]|uniref:uncharacterized protein LOC132704335 n=1 Tax=Cylas formicarius TaxID=197179 RepID=UPI002958C6AD|nr:uncharacterized protein LOC132704335 [Cylas formicarius]XP_060530261.1 uncharacterized protein LOC132704335 [Cylas formicarius]